MVIKFETQIPTADFAIKSTCYDPESSQEGFFDTPWGKKNGRISDRSIGAPESKIQTCRRKPPHTAAGQCSCTMVLNTCRTRKKRFHDRVNFELLLENDIKTG
ncbi:MAG: hypothetical protein LWW97_10095 [Deltaproteobacteria bacterium]|nr:hypothetical protein [Deltaproteobacteria bacterium]